MYVQEEVDVIKRGIELSFTTWGKMRGHELVTGDINYVKANDSKGIERIFSVSIEENVGFRIQQMISYIKEGIMPYSMLITPDTKPLNLADILSRKGFIISDVDPCMMMHLENYKQKDFEYSGFSVSTVSDKVELALWLHIVSDALFRRELLTLEQFNDVFILNNTKFYLGLLDSKPVTACMTVSDGDTACLDMVATLKEYRCKGFASAVAGKALLDLQQESVKSVSLRAEKDAVGIYSKLGFKESFKRIVASYDWQNISTK